MSPMMGATASWGWSAAEKPQKRAMCSAKVEGTKKLAASWGLNCKVGMQTPTRWKSTIS